MPDDPEAPHSPDFPENSDVDVLLATRNSDSFLEEALDSLVRQTHRDFNLIVSDDASSDRTIPIIRQFERSFARPVTLIERQTPSGSASANFASLLEASTARYVFLADHDDVWLPDKISRSLRRLKELEAHHGADTPLLMHTDLHIIDASGAVQPSTLWELKDIDPEFGTRLNGAMMHATVTGCAAAMNKALVQRALPIPTEAVMHDWWLNLVAAAFGKVEYDPVSTIRYRIHGANVSRPRRVSLANVFQQRSPVSKVRHNLRLRTRQARAFLQQFGQSLDAPNAKAVAAFAALDQSGPLTKRRTIIKHGFFYPGLWRNVAILLLA